MKKGRKKKRCLVPPLILKSRCVPSRRIRWFLPLTQLQEITATTRKSTTPLAIYNLQQAAGHSITATPDTKNTLMYKLNHLHLSVKGNRTLILFLFKLTIQCSYDRRRETAAQIPNTKMYSSLFAKDLSLASIKTPFLLFLFFVLQNQQKVKIK